MPIPLRRGSDFSITAGQWWDLGIEQWVYCTLSQISNKVGTFKGRHSGPNLGTVRKFNRQLLHCLITEHVFRTCYFLFLFQAYIEISILTQRCWQGKFIHKFMRIHKSKCVFIILGFIFKIHTWLGKHQTGRITHGPPLLTSLGYQ